MFQDIIDQITAVIPLSKVEIEFIKSKFVLRRYKASDFVIRPGEVCNFDGYIQEGLFRIYIGKEENEQIIQFRKEKQWVADYNSFTSGKPSTIYIQAIEDSIVWMTSKLDLEEIEHKIPAWTTIKSAFYEYQFVQKDNDYKRRITQTPEDRYLHILGSNPSLLDRVPQYYIAQYIGIKPESLSRLRKRIATQNRS